MQGVSGKSLFTQTRGSWGEEKSWWTRKWQKVPCGWGTGWVVSQLPRRAWRGSWAQRAITGSIEKQQMLDCVKDQVKGIVSGEAKPFSENRSLFSFHMLQTMAFFFCMCWLKWIVCFLFCDCPHSLGILHRLRPTAALALGVVQTPRGAGNERERGLLWQEKSACHPIALSVRRLLATLFHTIKRLVLFTLYALTWNPIFPANVTFQRGAF